MLVIMSTQEQELQQIRRKIFDELTKIVDPEIGVKAPVPTGGVPGFCNVVSSASSTKLDG